MEVTFRAIHPDEFEACLDVWDGAFSDTPREYFRKYFTGDPWFHPEVPETQVLPLAIVISPTLHQYPRAFLHLDTSFRAHSCSADEWLAEAHQKMTQMVESLRQEAECLDTAEKILQAGFSQLVKGRASVNERWWARMMP